jgi:hypothetical protein
MKAAQSAAEVRGRQPVFAQGMADRHDALDVTSVQTQTDDSLNRLWPGLARPSTTRGTCLAGLRGCPAQGRARTIKGGLNHLNASEHQRQSTPEGNDYNPKIA